MGKGSLACLQLVYLEARPYSSPSCRLIRSAHIA